MKNCTIGKWFCGAVLVNSLGISMVQAAELPASIIGKDEWLYYRIELSDSGDAATTDASLDLIQRFNRVLAANGISMAVAVVPLKMRIYPEHMPDTVKVNDYMKGNYDRMSKALLAAGVNVIDVNTSFLTSPKRDTPNPFYFRLDTHWAPSGALLAAETVKAGIDANPTMKKALDSMPEVKYSFASSRRAHSKARDLVDQLPPNSPSFGLEQFTPMRIARVEAAKEDLLGNRTSVGLTLVGSSYSSAWTGFPDALRYTLQRDLLSISVGADQGSWIGIESYLSDDSFQTQKPKLLIWEMPERDMRAPPDFKFRDARYVINNTEWLLRASAWTQTSCKPSAVVAKLAPVGLAASSANVKGADLATGATNEGDFAEIVFDKPIEKLDYLSLRASAAGSKTITLEASGPGVATRRFTVNVPGDDAAHALKTPLPSNGNGFAKVRIIPGKTNGFALQGLQVCRQPEDLLR